MLTTDGPRERILLLGGWGTGKSYAAQDIALMAREPIRPAPPGTTPPTIRVIDTTYEADRNFAGAGNVDIATCEGFRDVMTAVRKFREVSTKDDWLVVDRLDPIWDLCQASFSEEAFGKEIEDWFLEYRKSGAAGHPFAGDYGVNWTVIKRMYQGFVTELMRFPGHVLVTAKAETVQEPNREGKGGDSTEIRAEFGKWGVKPGGEKNTGFLFHTVLLLAEVRQGEWVFSTVRDRNREQVRAREMVRFTTSYLVGVAGWSL